MCGLQEYKRFWPEEGEPEMDFDNFRVAFQAMSEDGHYVNREFLLQSTQVYSISVLLCAEIDTTVHVFF